MDVTAIGQKLRALAARGALYREARLRQLGLEDPGASYQRAARWALLRNDLADRCCRAAFEGRLEDAHRLACRWDRAAQRVRAAQHEAQRRLAAIQAFRRQHPAD